MRLSRPIRRRSSTTASRGMQVIAKIADGHAQPGFRTDNEKPASHQRLDRFRVSCCLSIDVGGVRSPEARPTTNPRHSARNNSPVPRASNSCSAMASDASAGIVKTSRVITSRTVSSIRNPRRVRPVGVRESVVAGNDRFQSIQSSRGGPAIERVKPNGRHCRELSRR